MAANVARLSAMTLAEDSQVSPVEQLIIESVSQIDRDISDNLRLHGSKPSSYPSISTLEAAYLPYYRQICASWSFRNSDSSPSNVKVAIQDIIFHDFPPCLTPLDELEQIFVKDLRYGVLHKDKVLSLTTISAATPGATVQVLAKDAKGKGILVYIHACWDGKGNVSDFLPKGSTLLVKQPVLQQRFEQMSLVIDHRTDVVIEKNWSEIASVEGKLKEYNADKDTPEFWKDFGNHAFKKKRYGLAIDCYSEGLKRYENAKTSSIDIQKLLYLNRAQAYLTHGDRHHSALLDTERVLNLDTENSKALYRSILAYCGQNRFLEAAKALKIWKGIVASSTGPDKASNMQTVAQLQKRIDARIAESRTGNYDFPALVQAGRSFEMRKMPVDVGDYTHPNVGLTTPEYGVGKGLVVGRDGIKAGELVMVQKAFHMETGNPFNAASLLYNDAGSKLWEMGVAWSLTAALVDKHAHCHEDVAATNLSRIHDWEFDPDFTTPHPSLDKEGRFKTVDGERVIDTHLTNRYREICAITTIPAGTFDINVVPAFMDKGKTDPTIATVERQWQAGVWLMPTKLNHSCRPNLYAQYFSDVIVLRAYRDVKAGEELSMSYIQYSGDLLGVSARRKFLGTRYGFLCGCVRCMADEKHPVRDQAKHDELYNDIINLYLGTQDRVNRDPTKQLKKDPKWRNEILPSLRKLVAELEDQYATRNCVHSHITNPQLARSYLGLNFFLFWLDDEGVNHTPEIWENFRKIMLNSGWDWEKYKVNAPENSCTFEEGVRILRQGEMNYVVLESLWAHIRRLIRTGRMHEASRKHAKDHHLEWTHHDEEAYKRISKEMDAEIRGWVKVTKLVWVVIKGCDVGWEEVRKMVLMEN